MAFSMQPGDPFAGFTCVRCGRCCQSYTQTLLASREDIQRWRDQKRWDILRHVSLQEANGSLFGEIWMDPSTGKELPVCPFLKPASRGRLAFCSIHATRPRVCRDYLCRKHIR